MKKYFFLLPLMLAISLNAFCDISKFVRPFNSGSSPIFHRLSKASPFIGDNWSGYVAAYNLSTPSESYGRVSEVSGTWVVPKLKGNTGSCAIWIGIDGYFSTIAGEQVLEQIGTKHSIKNGKQTNTVFYQMYPSGPVTIKSIPCDPGDSITATLTLQAVFPLTFTVTIVNHTKSKSYSNVNVAAPTYAALATAEWIIEDPQSNGLLPLANFGTVKFSKCYALIDRIKGPINSANWHHAGITMKNAKKQIKAIPSAIADIGMESSFSVQWKHD